MWGGSARSARARGHPTGPAVMVRSVRATPGLAQKPVPLTPCLTGEGCGGLIVTWFRGKGRVSGLHERWREGGREVIPSS